MAKNPTLKEMAGQRFSLWVVKSKVGNTPNGAAVWRCACDCGTLRDVLGADLRSGKSKSCGCVGKNLLGNASRKHGATGTRLYNIWKEMRGRCRRSTHAQYAYYGGRGIAICPEWDDFSAFRYWALKNGYTEQLSIERVDVDGGYSPANCTWATPSEQSANRRFVSKAPDGQPWLHKAIANDVTRDAFYMRKRRGWPLELAATLPMGTKLGG